MKKISLFFIFVFILLVNIALAVETKDDGNYKVTFLISSGVTTDYDDVKVSSVMGERGVGNYTSLGYLIKRGILYILNIITEITPPTIYDLRNTSTTNESSFIEWSCSELCNYSILWYNSTDLVGSIYNNSFVTSHNPYLANLTNSTTYFINLTVWDGAGNSANNNTFNFTTAKTIIIDEISPTYSSFQNNGSTVRIHGFVNWSINLSDETELSFYIFAHNQSGTLRNVSNGTLSGTSAFVNKTLTITLSQGNYICGQFWVNDSSNNVNQTLLTESGACFTVANTPPEQPIISYPSDGGNYTDVSINYSASDVDGDALTYNIYINGSLNISGISGNVTDWNASDGYYNLTVSANDGTDSSINSSVRHFRIDTLGPSFSNFQNNGSTVKINGFVNWSINLADNGAGLSFYIFAHNESGTLGNVSNGTLSGTSAFVNKTLTITLPQGNYICGQFWVNDSVNNINQTLLTESGACFTVANTAPTTPNVTSPVNNTNYTSIPEIRYSSTDADNNVITYEIYVNGILNITSTTNVTNWNISDGSYNLSVTANDGVDSSANSSVISFRLNITEAPPEEPSRGGGGGGGGGGVVTPIEVSDFSVDERLIENVLKPGEITADLVEILNTGETTLEITIDVKNLGKFVFLSKDLFTLKPGELEVVGITTKIPLGTELGVYVGRLIIQSGTLKKIVNVIIEVESEGALLDVDIDIPLRFKNIFAGEEVLAQIILYNLGSVKRADVTLNYSIKDMEGNVIFTEQETVAVETQTSLVVSFDTTSNLIAGDYVFEVKASYDDSVATATDIFTVVEKTVVTVKPSKLTPINVLIVVLSLILVCFIIFIILAVINLKHSRLFENEDVKKKKHETLCQLLENFKK